MLVKPPDDDRRRDILLIDIFLSLFTSRQVMSELDERSTPPIVYRMFESRLNLKKFTRDALLSTLPEIVHWSKVHNLDQIFNPVAFVSPLFQTTAIHRSDNETSSIVLCVSRLWRRREVTQTQLTERFARNYRKYTPYMSK